MSDKLDRLAKQLEALPESSNQIEKTMVSLLKTQGKVAAMMFSMDGDATSGRSILNSLVSTVKSSTSTLGESHPANVILRQMIAIATAKVEGKPEPSDSDLERIAAGKSMAAASGSAQVAKKGCAIFIAALLGAGALVSVAVSFLV